MMDDTDPLRRFVRDHDEVAFAELVRQHFDWVYSAALRQLNGDAHLARDAVQLVFTDLARKAPRIVHQPRLGGWLFTSTRFIAAKLVRSEQRRRAREQEASAMHELTTGSPKPTDWDQLRPVLDDALDELVPEDRDAVLLRFFENHDYMAIGARFAIPANTARMRVDRALEKLHAALARRGITSTAAAVATALGAHAVSAAPAGLVTSVTAAALAGGAAVSGGTLATLFTMTKLPLGLTAAIVVGGTATLVIQHQTHSALRAEVEHLAAAVERTETVAPRVPSEAAPPASPAPVDPAIDRAYATLEQEATSLSARLAELDRATAKALGHAPVEGKVHELSELTIKPAPTRRKQPRYPAEFRNPGTNGQAVIAFTVDSAGNVRDLATVSATHEAFAQAALEALAEWQFSPGQIAGRAVNTRLQQPMVFNITNESPPMYEWF